VVLTIAKLAADTVDNYFTEVVILGVSLSQPVWLFLPPE